ncbi:type I restriction endonuclease subunit R [Leptothoe kymatousa]|uniref:Type I restriction endonuclease subunit R n=1 Tax=Leptothoe kymatousa TAU-MAC 1615 TaxID=2364775 RepID=A0ABS5Y177_9CYAN|nr:type I restriction endonuclease subunit R [Leptothoe kymatousa]MBT9311189.1 type I restriction endonuclease subunit R [Leptothoe kymatousa TAU-MAC 1615]
MTQTLAVTTAITNLNEAHQRLNLRPANGADFFSEWQGELPALSPEEVDTLDRLKARYRYYQADGAITESTVDFILVSPLLELLGLCDPPYKLRGEKYISIEIESGDTVLRGLIDVLIVQDGFWLVLLETKRYGFSVMQALPQTLAYLASADAPQAFGLITTGEDFLFVTADLQTREYDISDKFTLSTRHENQLQTVVKIMKKLIS